MSKEYDLQTDVLATIVATTPVTPKHTGLLTAFATRTEFRGARDALTLPTFVCMLGGAWPTNGRGHPDQEGRA